MVLFHIVFDSLCRLSFHFNIYHGRTEAGRQAGWNHDNVDIQNPHPTLAQGTRGERRYIMKMCVTGTCQEKPMFYFYFFITFDDMYTIHEGIEMDVLAVG